MNIYIYILYTNMYQLSHTVLSSTPFKFVSSTSFRLSLGEFECGDSLESNIAFFLMDLPAFLAIARNRDLGALRRNITWVLWVGCASGGGLSSNSILLSWKELVQPQDSHPLPWYIRFFWTDCSPPLLRNCLSQFSWQLLTQLLPAFSSTTLVFPPPLVY